MTHTPPSADRPLPSADHGPAKSRTPRQSAGDADHGPARSRTPRQSAVDADHDPAESRPSRTSEEDRPKTASLFVTCLVDAFYPEVGFAVVDILEHLGLRVEVPEGLTCCGQPAFNAGFWDDARAVGRHTIDMLSESGPIVIPSGSCTDMIVHQYEELFADEPEYLEKARRLAERTYELTQFLVDVLGVEDVGAAVHSPGGAREQPRPTTTASSATVKTATPQHAQGRPEPSRGVKTPVAYHACCHGLRGLGISTQPRCLLANVDRIEERALIDAESCCGFGGLFAVKMADISGAMLQRKLDAIDASGAEVVAVTDVSCLMHMAGGLHRRGSQVRVQHVAEILRPAK